MRSSRWIALAAALVVVACGEKSAPPGPPPPVDQDRDGFDSTRDCDDLDAAVQASVDAWLDTDGDGVGGGVTYGFCTDGSIPDGYVDSSTDCAPGDPGAWRSIASPLLDADGDGYTVAGTTPICAGATLPVPYVEASRGPDCDDGDAAAYRWVSLYLDADGDGVGACPRTAAWTCAGALPAGYAAVGCDVDDGNPAIAAHPGDAAALAVVLD